MLSVGTTGSHTVYASRGLLPRAPRLALRAHVVPPAVGTLLRRFFAEAPRVSVAQTVRALCERGLVPDRAPLQPHINVCGLY
ncbi:hypothetical protein EVAR_11053_1 [Eumeta japonica]|uniref:Uncharacterized protein n=1 Tax=Eumeta variegata TaxID=151549 RepID=A0A4C1U3X3_EUMVA|nr:hypothetical protein EVAR_11053_1 [Eumeta japonica]